MEAHTLFLQLVLILISARLCGELLARLDIPPVVGELLAGVLLGPSLLGWIEPNETIRLFAEFGIIMLLFEVGLETDGARLIQAGGRATLVALLGFALPFILSFAVAYELYALSPMESLLIGGTLTATSIGITVRVLSDLKRHHSLEAQVVLGAAVLDDILGIVLLALLYDYAQHGEMNLANAGRVGLYMLLFFALAPIAAKLLSGLIRHFERSAASPGLISSMVVSLVLMLAWLAHAIGAPELLGGFAAGLALSRRFFMPFGIALHTDAHFAGRIEQKMKPIVHLFTPIFFVSVGLSLDLSSIDWSSTFIWLLSAALLLAAIIGKLAGPLPLALPLHQKVLIGIAMIPRGEVGLIFAELGRSSGIIHNELHAALVIVIAVTTLMSPYALKLAYRHLPGAREELSREAAEEVQERR